MPPLSCFVQDPFTFTRSFAGTECFVCQMTGELELDKVLFWKDWRFGKVRNDSARVKALVDPGSLGLRSPFTSLITRQTDIQRDPVRSWLGQAIMIGTRQWSLMLFNRHVVFATKDNLEWVNCRVINFDRRNEHRRFRH